MIEHLIMCGISKKTIEVLKSRQVQFYSLTLNEEECIKTIIYLKFIGIKNIDEILLYRPELFLNTKLEVSLMFEKNDIQEIVKKINDNYENIDILFD